MNQLLIMFLSLMVLSFAILLLGVRPVAASRSTQRRLVRISHSIKAPLRGLDGRELEKPDPWGHSARLDAVLERFRFAKQLKTLLTHADSRLGLGGVAVASAGTSLGCGLLCFLSFPSVTIAGVVAVAAFLIPYGHLRFKRTRRLKAFNEALPDAIDLMARSLTAGHSMGSAIEMVAEQSPEPVAFEFVQVFQQQRLGLHFREALLEMGSRVPSRDLQFLITAILIQKETGGDLTEILARASHVIRERVRIQGEVQTRTAQGRLTGWILGAMPIVMLVLMNIISPGYSSILFHDPMGQDLLYTGVVLIFVGGVIIHRIVDVQV